MLCYVIELGLKR